MAGAADTVKLVGAAGIAGTVTLAVLLGADGPVLFTAGLVASTVAGNLLTATQTVSKNTVYYYRIRANNSIGDSSAWTNALPFPIRTGP